MPNEIIDIWKDNFPQFVDPDDAALQALLGSASLISVPAGQHLFQPGARCDNCLLVTSGEVRVQLITHSGREVVLHHVGPGNHAS